jgi:hypothetical protein
MSGSAQPRRRERGIARAVSAWARRSESDPLAAQKVIHLEA